MNFKSPKNKCCSFFMRNTCLNIDWKTVTVHCLFWLVYILSEYLANMVHIRPGNTWPFFKSILLTLPVLLLATYFVALYAVPRFVKNNNWLLFIFWIVVAGALIFFGRIKWMQLINYLESGSFFNIPVSKVLKNVIRDYAIVALAVCVYVIGDYRKKQKQNEQLIKAKAEVEIKLLKGQLHPHFLFNSLNNIYSLALVKSDFTADSILKLTELLDYLVYKANLDQVPLAKEVELIENYLGLEQLRYGDKLVIEQEIEMQNGSQKISPLLLLPFVENCFKHGGVGSDKYFRINLKLVTSENRLEFYLSNTKEKQSSAKWRSRIEKYPTKAGVVVS